MSKENMNGASESALTRDPQNAGRRRAVKTIAGGVGALAAYHVLPVDWSQPIVEQIFLPAHAAVSGLTLSDPCTVELISGDQSSSIDVIRVSGFVTPPVGGLSVGIAVVEVKSDGSSNLIETFTTTDGAGTYSVEINLPGPGVIGAGIATGIEGARNISSCSIGIPPAQQPNPPTSTPAATTTPPPTSTPAATTTPAATITAVVNSVTFLCATGFALVRSSITFLIPATYNVTATNLDTPNSDNIFVDISGNVPQTVGEVPISLQANTGDRIQITVTDGQGGQATPVTEVVAGSPGNGC